MMGAHRVGGKYPHWVGGLKSSSNFDWDDVCTRNQLKLEPLIKIPPGFFHGNEFVILIKCRLTRKQKYAEGTLNLIWPKNHMAGEKKEWTSAP